MKVCHTHLHGFVFETGSRGMSLQEKKKRTAYVEEEVTAERRTGIEKRGPQTWSDLAFAGGCQDTCKQPCAHTSKTSREAERAAS